MRKPILALLYGLTLTSCIHPQVTINKSGILDPMIDPAKTSGLRESLLFGEPPLGIEKANLMLGGGFGASCPTCGG
jgi:hypothetical protein